MKHGLHAQTEPLLHPLGELRDGNVAPTLQADDFQ